MGSCVRSSRGVRWHRRVVEAPVVVTGVDISPDQPASGDTLTVTIKAYTLEEIAVSKPEDYHEGLADRTVKSGSYAKIYFDRHGVVYDLDKTVNICEGYAYTWTPRHPMQFY